VSRWILLRGLTRESRHWGDFPAQLASTLPDARIQTVDLPGNGRRHDQTSPTCMAAMADHCRNAVRQLGLPPPYHLLALSLGAMVALAWARAAPADVAGAVLINTSLRPFSPWYRRLRPSAWGPLLRLLLAADARPRESIVLRLTSARSGEWAGLLDAWTRWRRECPVSTANALRQLWAAARYRSPLAAPPVPLLLLAGARDRLVHPDCSRRLAATWQVPLAEHPDAGHDLPLDDGPWVARQVLDWLRTGR